MRDILNLTSDTLGAGGYEDGFESAAQAEGESRSRGRFTGPRYRPPPRPRQPQRRPRHSHHHDGRLCRSRWCGPAVFAAPAIFGYAPDVLDGIEYIRWVQEGLNKLLGLRLVVSGALDAATRSAIRSFQRRERLPETGIVGPDTERALAAATSTDPPASDDGDDNKETSNELESGTGRNSKEYIRWLQQSLNRVAQAGLLTDGTMGARTRYALRRYQRSANLKADGIPDAATEAALVKAGSAPLPGSNVLPIKPAKGGPSISSVPRLLREETQPPGRTLYLEIDLKNVHQRTNKPVNPITGVFIPEGFAPRSEVDVILYLHGFDLAGCNKTIETYWKTSCQPHFPLREGINQSGKSVILVAPTLGSKSEPGSLVKPGGLDTYLDQVLVALKAHARFASTPKIGSLILASHSGGGLPMRQIANATNSYSSRIRECWGFDCTYNSGDAALWAEWAKRNPRSEVFIYYIPGEKSGTRSQAENLKRMNVSNVLVERATRSHNWVPITFWKTRIQGAPFLKNR